MSQELLKLVLGEVYKRPRYVFEGENGLPYELWVPTLLDIRDAQTIGAQREALTNGIVRVVASHHGLKPASRSRAEVGFGYKERARFSLDGGVPALKHISIGRIAMGFQSPDEQCPNPAFAVVDKPEEKYHRVVKDSEEELTPTEHELGLEVISSLATTMDNWYPGFELPQKLADHGIQL